MHTKTSNEKTLNLQEIYKKGHMERIMGKKGKEDMMQLCYNIENKR